MFSGLGQLGEPAQGAPHPQYPGCRWDHAAQTYFCDDGYTIDGDPIPGGNAGVGAGVGIDGYEVWSGLPGIQSGMNAGGVLPGNRGGVTGAQDNGANADASNPLFWDWWPGVNATNLTTDGYQAAQNAGTAIANTAGPIVKAATALGVSVAVVEGVAAVAGVVLLLVLLKTK